jgi:hypothetical protein
MVVAWLAMQIRQHLRRRKGAPSSNPRQPKALGVHVHAQALAAAGCWIHEAAGMAAQHGGFPRAHELGPRRRNELGVE